MNFRQWPILCVGVAVGCVGDDTNPPVPPAADASADATVSVDASTANDSASADSAPAPLDVVLVRLAHWSPSAPAIDFCLAAHGSTSFQGPLLAEEGALLEAGPGASLTYPGVSAYFQVPAGRYDARVVVSGASDCSVGVAADLTSLPPWPVGTFATLGLVGTAGGAGAAKLALEAYVDDGIGGAKLALRFINAASSTPVDFGTGAAAAFSPLFRSVGFGSANAVVDGGGADGAVTFDSNGYALLPGLASATLSARRAGATTDSIVATGVSAAGGAVVTTALIGVATGADGGNGMQLLQCVDNAGTVGLLGACTVLGP